MFNQSGAISIAPPAADKLALMPQFALNPGGTVVVREQPYLVERRVRDRWQFISIDTREPLFLGDHDLAALLREGQFYIESGRGGQVFAPSPVSPIAIGPNAHARNLRKHAYVSACLKTGELRRSRRWLLPVIHAAATERGEPPPGFSTVLNWLDEYERHGQIYGTAAYSDRHDLKGNRSARLLPYQEQAIEEGLDAWLKLRKLKLGYDIVCAAVRKYDESHGRDIDKGDLGARFVGNDGRLLPPSLRTFERRAKSMNRMLADWGIKGPAYAKRKNLTWQTTKRPERPYAEVEVDHARLDLIVIDESGLVLGRPVLTVLRDRATAMVIGYGLGFEEPSYASFMQALRHAIYPKAEEDYPDIKSGWPCFGRIENLYVDNGLEFVGNNIQEAGAQLDFNIVRCPPRQPWFKGALERFFGTLNAGLVHMLAGTTLENVLARRDHENLGEATYTLAEFNALLCFWICEVYHNSSTRALGPIPGVGGTPLSAWREKVSQFTVGQLPHPDLFIALAGDFEMRTIQNDGIVWDYIKYESPELWALRSDPHHRRRTDGAAATRYKIVRDPFDLGHIRIHVPWNDTVLTIPAALGYRDYAGGLTLHQHRVILSNARSKTKEQIELSDLQAARSHLAEIALKLRKSPGRKKIMQTLSRYLESGTYRRLYNVPVAQGNGAGGDFSDLHADTALPPETVSHRDIAWEDDDDLERHRQSKNWKSYNDN